MPKGELPTSARDLAVLRNATPAQRVALRKMNAQTTQLTRTATALEKAHAAFPIPGDQPQHMLWLSDMHLGSDATDERLLDSMIEYVKRTPGVFVAYFGDHVDGYDPEKVGTIALRQTLSPIDQ